jgi:hypothetical protein
MTTPRNAKACRIVAAGSLGLFVYAVLFFCLALIFAQRARIASAIFLRATADMVWSFAGADPVVVAALTPGFDSFRTLAQRAFCACAIFIRDAAEITRVGWFVFPDVPVPFNDSMTDIA